MVTKVQLKILDSEFYSHFQLPEYATEYSAGMDLRACIKEPLTIHCQETVLIPTGIAINMPAIDMVAALHPRSSLGHKFGIVLGNLTGIIDEDYQNQLFISAWNRNRYEEAGKDFTVTPGDRIAQMLFLPILRVEFDVVDDFEESERGLGGFGSTGLK